MGGDYTLFASTLSTGETIFRGSDSPGSFVFPAGSPQFFITARNSGAISPCVNAMYLVATRGIVAFYASAKSVRDALNAHRLRLA